MSTASLALEAQVWSVMESLAKAAAAEICSLVDSQCVEMRLEIRRGQTEIESLKGKLRELRKALREKSTSTVSQINPQLGESERDIRTDDLYQEADCVEKEQDKKTSFPGLMNLQEDSIQDDLNSHLDSGINQFTQSQILSDSLNSEDEADTGGLDTAAVKVEAGSYSVSTAECIYAQKLSPDTHSPVIGVLEQEKKITEMENLNRLREEAPTSAPRVKVKIECIEDDENMQVVQDATSQNRTELALQSGSTENEELAQVWSSDVNTDMHSPEIFNSTYDQAHHWLDPAAAIERSYVPPEDGMEATGCSNGEDITRHSKPSTDSLHVAMDDLPKAQNVPGLQQSNSNTHSTLIHPQPEAQSNFSALSALPVRGRPSNRSMDVDKRRFSCMFCSKTFDRPSHAERHQRIHTGEKPFNCRLCGRSFTWKWVLKNHLKTHRSSNRFHAHSHVERHQRMHTGEKSFSCGLCDRSFTRKCSLKSHLTTHQKESRAFDSNLSNPIGVKEENYENISAALEEEQISPEMCYVMQSEDPTVALPISHNSTSDPLQTTETSVVSSVPFDSVHQIQRSKVVTGVLRRRTRREQRFICVQCGKTFYWMSCLDRHQLVHTGEKPYSCGLCGRSFTQKSHLKRHMRRNCCP